LDAILGAAAIQPDGVQRHSGGNQLQAAAAVAENWNAMPRYLLQPGPIKQPRRSLEKMFRKFGADPRALTDIVRCSVLVDSVAHAQLYLAAILSRSNQTCNGGSATEGPIEQLFAITKIRDDFSSPDRLGAAETGRRSIGLNLEVAWDGATGSRLVLVQTLFMILGLVVCLLRILRHAGMWQLLAPSARQRVAPGSTPPHLRGSIASIDRLAELPGMTPVVRTSGRNHAARHLHPQHALPRARLGVP